MAEKIWQVLEGYLTICYVVAVMVFLVQICFSEVKSGVILAFVVLTSYWVLSLLFTEKIISFMESIRDGSSNGSNNFRWESVRTILALCSAIIGMVFLGLSSFSEDQFGENQRLQSLVFIILSAFFVANIFFRKKIFTFLESRRGKYLYTKAVVQCISFAMVSVVAFLIKYPRFNIHSAAFTTPCSDKDQEINEIFNRVPFRLIFFQASSLLTLIVSPQLQQTQETMALKVSSWLLGLAIENSMDIPGRDGPNLGFMYSIVELCIFSIFLKHYMESRGGNTCLEGGGRIFEYLFRVFLSFGLYFILCLPIYLYIYGDFTFVVEYILFLILGLIIYSEMEGKIDHFSDCYSECKEKASLNIFLLLITGILMISNKDNRFQIQSKLKKICGDEEKVKELPRGSQFNLYTAAAFSLYALMISLEKDQSMELGIFDFLLQLTVEASIDLTSVWHIVGASLFCVVLILARICLAPAKTRRNSNV